MEHSWPEALFATSCHAGRPRTLRRNPDSAPAKAPLSRPPRRSRRLAGKSAGSCLNLGGAGGSDARLQPSRGLAGPGTREHLPRNIATALASLKKLESAEICLSNVRDAQLAERPGSAIVSQTCKAAQAAKGATELWVA